MPFPMPTLVQQYLANSGLGQYIEPWLAPAQTNIAPIAQQVEQMHPTQQPMQQHRQYDQQFRGGDEVMHDFALPQLQENPALIAAEQPQQAPTNPIAQGVAEAKKAPLSVKQRIALSPEQRERAIGAGMRQFAHGMATSQTPTTSTLGKISENLGPALAAYDQGLAGARANNIEELKLEKELSKTTNMHGWAAKFADLERLGDEIGRDNPVYLNAKKAQEIELKNMQSNIDNRYSLMSGRKFHQMPKADQRWVTAMGRSMGIPPDEVINLTNDGYTINQIAEMHGHNADDITPDYTPTEANITDQKKRDAIVAEVQVLNNKVKSAIKPYAATFFGYSPKQVADALSGENVEQQAQYLAARAMAPDLATLEVAAGRGSVSLGMIMDLKETALTDSHIFRPLVTPEVYDRMQDYINDWVTEMTEVAREEMYGKHKGGSKKKASDDYSSMSDEELREIAGG